MHQNAIKTATNPDRRQSINELPCPVLNHACNCSADVESVHSGSGTAAHTFPLRTGANTSRLKRLQISLASVLRRCARRIPTMAAIYPSCHENQLTGVCIGGLTWSVH